MGRRRLPATMMLEAIDNQDVEQFAWAILEQSRLDLRDYGENRTYSTVDVLSAMRQIVILQSKGTTAKESTNNDNDDLKDWLSKPQKREKTL